MTKKSPSNKRYRVLHIPFKEREYFTENLALLLKAAVPIGEALDSLSAGVRSRPLKKALANIQTDIDAGYNLAEALKRARIVSEQTLTLIQLGEASGNLVENLQIAAQQESKRQAFAAKVRSAFIYPSFVIVLTIVIGLAVAWFLLPRLSMTFAQLHVTLPPISRVMLDFGLFLRDYGIIAVPAFFGAVFLLLYILFGAPYTKVIGRRLLLHVPGVGRLLKEIEIAQFGYLLGTLIEAGLPITQALQLLADTTTSPAYKKLYRHLGESISDGNTFKQSLSDHRRSTKLIPIAVQQMIAAGERSGSLPDVLKSVGNTYEEKSNTTTENLETIIEPILLVTVAGGVLLVAVAVILPIYSLIGSLNQ